VEQLIELLHAHRLCPVAARGSSAVILPPHCATIEQPPKTFTIMLCFYLTPAADEYNKLPELQVCLAEALYDIESILADPSAYPDQELCRLRDQIVSNLERAGAIMGGTEDRLTGTLLQISQMVARDLGRSTVCDHERRREFLPMKRTVRIALKWIIL
ncbi:MAG: hypothetical protein ACYSYV_11595, partial [Planctomycetota bacterium]